MDVSSSLGKEKSSLEMLEDYAVPAKQADDCFSKKALREVLSLSLGTTSGALSRAEEYLRDPVVAAEGVAVPAVLGSGLAAMKLAGGRWAAAAGVAVSATAILAGADLGFRAKKVFDSISDNWDNPTHYLENKKQISTYLGGALVDYGVALGSGNASIKSFNKFFGTHELQLPKLSRTDETGAISSGEQLRHAVLVPPLAFSLSDEKDKG